MLSKFRIGDRVRHANDIGRVIGTTADGSVRVQLPGRRRIIRVKDHVLTLVGREPQMKAETEAVADAGGSSAHGHTEGGAADIQHEDDDEVIGSPASPAPSAPID